jgi:ABC-type glycerol-3-phosphate transport system substrate-binding protein
MTPTPPETNRNRSLTLNRRALLRGAGAAGIAASLGGLVIPRRARAATTVQFQTSAGARFGTPNAVLIEDFNRENPDIQMVMDTVPVQNYFPKLSTEVASNSRAGLSDRYT